MSSPFSLAVAAHVSDDRPTQARVLRFFKKSFRGMVACDPERIVECVRRRDGQGAGREMERHLDNLARGRAKAYSLKKP